jgi:hypothetical protein
MQIKKKDILWNLTKDMSSINYWNLIQIVVAIFSRTNVLFLDPHVHTYGAPICDG